MKLVVLFFERRKMATPSSMKQIAVLNFIGANPATTLFSASFPVIHPIITNKPATTLIAAVILIKDRVLNGFKKMIFILV